MNLLFIKDSLGNLRKYTGVISTKENRALTKEMLKYSAPLVPSGLSWWVMGASDRYVIRFILGSAANGIYAVANKFPTILSMLFTIFNYSWTDVAIGNLKEGKETSKYSSRIFENLYELAFCFTVALIPATKIVTKLILSDSYKSASIYISFLYLGALFQGLTAFIKRLLSSSVCCFKLSYTSLNLRRKATNIARKIKTNIAERCCASYTAGFREGDITDD